MKRSSLVAVSLIVLAAISAPATPNPSTAKVPAFPGILANARFYTTSEFATGKANCSWISSCLVRPVTPFT